jgi:hypothetical protein
MLLFYFSESPKMIGILLFFFFNTVFMVTVHELMQIPGSGGICPDSEASFALSSHYCALWSWPIFLSLHG